MGTGMNMLHLILLTNVSCIKRTQASLSVESLSWKLAEFVQCNADYYVNIIPVSSNSTVQGKRYQLTLMSSYYL